MESDLSFNWVLHGGRLSDEGIMDASSDGSDGSRGGLVVRPGELDMRGRGGGVRMGMNGLPDGVEVGLLHLDLLVHAHHSVAVSDALSLAELEDNDCQDSSTYNHTHLEDLVETLPLPTSLLAFLFSQVIAICLI